MDPAVLVAVLALCGTVAGLYVTFRKGKDDSKNKTEELQATALQSEFTRNLELNKYIDGVVEAAVAPFRTEIADLKKGMAIVNARESTTKNIIRRWFQRLLWWDDRGRVGPMPMPPTADMATLELTDIEADTMSREDVLEIRKLTDPDQI